MKKIVMTLVALLTMTSAIAQESNQENNRPNIEMRGRRQMTPEMMTENMAKQLNLTDEQKAKMLDLNTQYKDMFRGPGMRGPIRQRPSDASNGASEQKRREGRPEMTEEQKAAMQQMQEKRKEYNEKVKEILTEEQYKEYEKMNPHRGRGMGFRGQRGQRPPQMN